MSLNGTESEASSSTPPDTLTYKAYISNLAKKSPLLTFNSLSENDFGINSSTILSEFALLLTSLGVPGPSDLFARGEFLGAGAHFTVFKRDIIAVANFQKQRPAIQNDWRTVAVKMPIFLLDPEKKLDLADSNNSRQVRSMVLEITALCHPRLREHPNLVTLLAWGSSSLDWHEVPFIALEIADTDLAGLLQDQRDVSTVEKYQLALDIACGLDAIHEIELVHGDLKPENVLIFWESGGYIAKLADFGGAANVGKGGLWEGGGTIGWRAPEVQDFYETGKALDLSVLDRVDSYSFGLLLWSIFLRERARAPHDETNVNVERIALANLDDNCKNIPASLAIILKDSFSSLLKLDPRLRTNKLASLLNRDSQEHNDQPVLSGSLQQNPKAALGGNMEDNHSDCEIPEISSKTAAGLQTAFMRGAELSPAILYALIVKLLSLGQGLESNTNDRDLLLELLCAAALKNHRPAKSIVFRIYEYFELSPPPDISSSKLSWIASSVAEGAFFLRAELRRMDAELYKDSIATFRSWGGFTRFGAPASVICPEGIAQRLSNDGCDGLESTKPLNSHGDSALHIAAAMDQASTLSELLNRSSLRDINALNIRGETPLYRACMTGSTGNVLQLLSRKADASIRVSQEGPGYLHWIFQFDISDINLVVDELIGHGASINALSKQRIAIPYYPFTLPMGTALHWAVEMFAPEAVSALLRNGADPCLRDGSDPYEYDGSVRHLDRILPPDNTEYSVAEWPTMGLNAFDVAVQNRSHGILDILFSSVSTNVADQIDEEGHSALHRLDAGHWLRTRHGTGIWKPCIEGSRQKQKEAATLTIALLREHGFQLDQLTNPQPLCNGLKLDRRTPLMIAIKRRRLDTIQALIEAGANVECVNDTGKSALYAFSSEYMGFPSLQHAAINSLLRSKPDVNVRDINGDSPLTMAARVQLTGVGWALLERGADYCVRGNDLEAFGYRENALATFCRCNITRAHERDEWITMVLLQFVLPVLREGNKRMKEEVITNPGVNGGNLLHFTAHYGLRRCCQLLLEEGLVDCNQLSRGRKRERRGGVRGIFTHYRTPLDEAIKQANPPEYHWRSSFSASGAAQLYSVYEEIAEMLRAHGGVRGKMLKSEEFEAGVATFNVKLPNYAL